MQILHVLFSNAKILRRAMKLKLPRHNVHTTYVIILFVIDTIIVSATPF